MADEEQPRVDLLILTLWQEDYDGVVAFFGDAAKARHHPDGWWWYEAAWTTQNGRPLSVAIVDARDAALQGNLSRFAVLVDLVRPRLIVNLGIAYSLARSPGCHAVVVTQIFLNEPVPGISNSIGLPIQDNRQLAPLNVALVEFALHAPWGRIGAETLRASFNQMLVSTKEVPSKEELTKHDIEFGDMSGGIEHFLSQSYGVPLIVLRGVGALGSREARQTRVRDAATRLAAEFAVHFRDELRLSIPSLPSPPAAALLDPASTPPVTSDLFRDAVVNMVHIRGFKSIVDLTVDLTHTSGFDGHWTCLAGINGAGKSATQQALTLTLLGPRYAPEIGGALLDRMRRSDGVSTADATLRVALHSDDETIAFTLPITNRGIVLSGTDAVTRPPLWNARALNHLLLAYGPGRNLSEHDDNRHRNKSREVQRVMTLFDPLTQVMGAEAFLRDRMPAAAVALARGLLSVLLEGMPVTVTASTDALQFNMGAARLNPVDLPDGFRATIAWIVDLCIAWSEFAPQEAMTGELARIRALVVIDEIDLHLHPKLQRELVPRLRKLLPRVQWVVSTHSPLVLASFDRREIVMLENDEHGRVRQRELDRQVSGLTIDEVYRWLMETEPRSVAAMEASVAAETSPQAALEYAILLGQSPEHSEADARRAYAARAERLQRRQAEGVRDAATAPEDDPEEPGT